MRDESCKDVGADAICARIAGKQYGLIQRAQALNAGLSRSGIHRRVKGGRWQVVHPGVYRIAGTTQTWHQDMTAAHLWLGGASVLSHRSSAALLGLDGFSPGVVEITVPGRRPSERPGIIVHQTLRLAPGDRERRDGIPITSPTRTLVDLGAVVSPDAVEEALESALRQGYTTIEYLEKRLAKLGGPGCRGAGALHAVLLARKGGAPTGSRFETHLFRLLRAARLPLPERQVEIRDHRGWFVARPDFVYVDEKLIIEADSYGEHGGRLEWEHDIVRRNRLTALGWRIVQVTWRQLREQPGEVLGQIEAALVVPNRSLQI